MNDEPLIPEVSALAPTSAKRPMMRFWSTLGLVAAIAPKRVAGTLLSTGATVAALATGHEQAAYVAGGLAALLAVTLVDDVHLVHDIAHGPR